MYKIGINDKYPRFHQLQLGTKYLTKSLEMMN